MLRKFYLLAAVSMAWSFSQSTQAADFSPTQSQLNNLVFSDFWPDNTASLDAKALVGPQGNNPNSGVKYTFHTDVAYNNDTHVPTPDAFGTRTQFEAPLTTDLSSFGAFSVNFLANASVNPLQAKLYLRYGTNGFATTGNGVAINGTTQTIVSLPISLIPVANRNQITAFGVELFSLDSAFHEPETNAMVSAYTSPQYADSYLINGFEGTGSGSLENWGPAFQPDHISHTLVASTPQAIDRPPNNGVTQGTHALEIVRKFTGAPFPADSNPPNINFRWGSQMTLNAAGTPPVGDYNSNGTVDAADYTRWRDTLNTSTTLPNDSTPGTVNPADYTVWKTNFGQTSSADPAVQSHINQIVDAINGGDQIAFDVSMTAVDNFDAGEPNPSYTGWHMFITDGSSSFWQSDAFPGFNPPALGESVTVTLVAPLDTFTDRSAMPVAGNLKNVNLLKNAAFSLGLASNTDGRLTFQIDNIRVRSLVSGSGSIAGGSVPEPASGLLILLAIAGGAAVMRSRATAA